MANKKSPLGKKIIDAKAVTTTQASDAETATAAHVPPARTSTAIRAAKRDPRADLVHGWATAPERHPFDLMLEDIATIKSKGGNDRSARITTINNEETGEPELMIISTDRSAVEELVEQLQQGRTIRAKVVHRPSEDELMRIVGDTGMPALLGAAPPSATDGLCVEIMRTDDGRELVAVGGFANVADAWRYVNAWNSAAANRGFDVLVTVRDGDSPVREYVRIDGILKRMT